MVHEHTITVTGLSGKGREKGEKKGKEEGPRCGQGGRDSNLTKEQALF